MNSNTILKAKKSEREAIKTLLEVSHKENLLPNSNSDSEIDPWFLKEPFRKITNLPPKVPRARATSVVGKPPRSAKILNKVPTPKAETPSLESRNLIMPIISLIPPTSKTPLHFIKPPVPNFLKSRSRSFRSDSEYKRPIENGCVLRDISIAFRKKMVKFLNNVQNRNKMF